jgi:hypothetical protein
VKNLAAVVLIIINLLLIYIIVVAIVFQLYTLSVVYFCCLCSFVCCGLFELDVLFCMMCVICVLCLIVVPLLRDKNPFTVINKQ